MRRSCRPPASRMATPHTTARMSKVRVRTGGRIRVPTTSAGRMGPVQLFEVATIAARLVKVSDVATTTAHRRESAAANTVQPLSAGELFAWRSYVETTADLSSALEADLIPTGLTLGDYQVLVFLSEAEHHSMRMCDLAANLQLSPSGLTRRLDGLVRSGYVDRRPSSADRRVMLAILTEPGAAKLADAYP